MAIRITKVTSPIPQSQAQDSIAAHRAILTFEWVNDQTQAKGVSTREALYNWVVNQKGQAYFVDNEDKQNVYVFGVDSPPGEHWLRAIKDGKWNDGLLKLVA
jgi:hypothetical protein